MEQRKRQWAYGVLFIAAALAAAAWVLPATCGGPRPILIGFAGDVTGTYSDSGVSARNGAQLAVEHINAGGGVAGRPLELIARDDHDDLETALAVDRELKDLGVVAVVGHMTSSLCVAVRPHLDELDLILISPLASSRQLSGIKDHFFRVAPPSTIRASGLARHAREVMGLQRVLVVLDEENPMYSEYFAEDFQAVFTAHGGLIEGTVRFSSSDRGDWDEVVRMIHETEPQGLLVVASARDTAALARRLSSLGIEPALLVAPWGMNPALPREGGLSVEGAVSCHDYAEDLRIESLVQFRRDFQERFGTRPAHSAIMAYDAVGILARALETTGGSDKGLAEALAAVHGFPGVLGLVNMDEFGDVLRKTYIIVIRDGVITMLKEAES